MDKSVKMAVRYLEKLAHVKKIILGLSSCCRHRYRPGTLRVTRTTEAGIHANAYGGNGVTKIFLVVTQPHQAEVTQIIHEKYRAP